MLRSLAANRFQIGRVRARAAAAWLHKQPVAPDGGWLQPGEQVHEGPGVAAGGGPPGHQPASAASHAHSPNQGPEGTAEGEPVAQRRETEAQEGQGTEQGQGSSWRLVLGLLQLRDPMCSACSEAQQKEERQGREAPSLLHKVLALTLTLSKWILSTLWASVCTSVKWGCREYRPGRVAGRLRPRSLSVCVPLPGVPPSQLLPPDSAWLPPKPPGFLLSAPCFVQALCPACAHSHGVPETDVTSTST